MVLYMNLISSRRVTEFISHITMEMQAEDVHFGILLYHALNLLRK